MPTRIKNPLLFLTAQSDRKAISEENVNLHTENQILRELLPKNLKLSAEQKQRLIKVGKLLRANLKHLIGIVCYSTFLRWLRGEEKGMPFKSVRRPPTPEETRKLIIQLAQDNEWG